MRRLLLLASGLFLLPLPGCCSLARFFCGPDTTPWISVDHGTAQRAVQTLFEAVRRDAPEVVYNSLSTAYQRRLQLDANTMKLAWPRILEQNPGLHVAGYTVVPQPELVDANHARVRLDVVGTPVEVRVVRQARWELRYRRADGRMDLVGDAFGSFDEVVRIERIPDGDNESNLTIAPLRFPHGARDVAVGDVESAALHHVWKVDDVRVVDA